MARIFVKPDVLQTNLTKGEGKPPIVVELGDEQKLAHLVEILDSQGNVLATVVYKKRLGGVAQVWVEVDQGNLRYE